MKKFFSKYGVYIIIFLIIELVIASIGTDQYREGYSDALNEINYYDYCFEGETLDEFYEDTYLSGYYDAIKDIKGN